MYHMPLVSKISVVGKSHAGTCSYCPQVLDECNAGTSKRRLQSKSIYIYD